MLIISMLSLFVSGLIAGYQSCIRRYRAKSKILIDADIYHALVARDTALWQIERAERSKIYFQVSVEAGEDRTSPVTNNICLN